MRRYSQPLVAVVMHAGGPLPPQQHRGQARSASPGDKCPLPASRSSSGPQLLTPVGGTTAVGARSSPCYPPCSDTGLLEG
jgi:hypothetical protein